MCIWLPICFFLTHICIGPKHSRPESLKPRLSAKTAPLAPHLHHLFREKIPVSARRVGGGGGSIARAEPNSPRERAQVAMEQPQNSGGVPRCPHGEGTWSCMGWRRLFLLVQVWFVCARARECVSVLCEGVCLPCRYSVTGALPMYRIFPLRYGKDFACNARVTCQELVICFCSEEKAL